MRQRALLIRIGLAFLASLLLHIAMISGAWLRVPEKSPEPPPLQARLERRAPVPPPPRVADKPPPRVRPALPRAAPEPPRIPTIAAPAPIVIPEPEPSLPAEEPAAAAPQADEAAPQAASLPAAPEAAPSSALPRRGRIVYTVYLGTDQFTVGRTVQTWQLDGAAYRLGSVSETTGIADLFRAQRLVYLSAGRITPRGLQPESFLMSRTRRGQTEEARARFDWDAGTIAIGKPPAQRTAELPAASQDIVSFMYQLALAPPAPGRIRLPITNGSRFETYDLDVLEEEEIETPLGPLKTLPVKQVRKPGAEGIEIWFAIDYRYLPVKLRFYDREGSPSGEQVVNEIRISEE
ncbi:MAG: DUF3108 domain-containing protein [Betaproteobacteria bacterium]|nr:DUF3108 domain-containing protein [Betaproteobacteria bacterium]